MTSEIIRKASDAGASFGSFLEARSRIRVGEKKVIIRSRRTQGYSLRDFATELDTTKIPTKDGKPTWSHTSVKSILNRAA